MQQLVVLYTPGPGAIVWDPCAGSMSTANACSVTNRMWVGSEKNHDLCKAAITRHLMQVSAQLMWTHGLQVPVTQVQALAVFKKYTEGFVKGATTLTERMRKN